MADRSDSQCDRVGLVRVRSHCTFTWRRAAGGDEKNVEVLPDHCVECVLEVRRRGYKVIYKRPDIE
jgi:hypothetical protein